MDKLVWYFQVNTAKKINTLKTLIDKGATQKQWLKTCKSWTYICKFTENDYWKI